MNYAEKKLLTRIAHVLVEKTHDNELQDILDTMEKNSLVFVYGTLRDEDREIYTLKGYRLEATAAANYRFPVIVPDPDKEVIGNVIECTPEELMKNDNYESCGDLYDRKKVTVSDEQKSIDAWVYVPLRNSLRSERNRVIDSGDWFVYLDERAKSQTPKVGDFSKLN